MTPPDETNPHSRVDDPQRRRFLQLMGASAALASGACSGPPPEHIVPYVDLPPELAPAAPLFYASAFVRGGYGHGVLVESNLGRATKVEGNALHPASLGGTDVYAQASVLELWDPERSRAVYRRTQIASWAAFDAALTERLRALAARDGEGLRVLTGPTTSPTLVGRLQALARRYPQSRWHAYDPLDCPQAHAGVRLAFGREAEPVYRFGDARIAVALDCDFLSEGAGAVRYAHDFFQGRREPGETMSRLYALESTPGLAGAMADERLALPPPEIERTIWRLAARLDAAPQGVFAPNPRTARWEAALAAALGQHRGASVLIPGRRLSAQTQALVHRLNARLGNVGTTLFWIAPPRVRPDDGALAALVADMHAGRVDTLLVLDANPLYDAPADFAFARALARVPMSVHAGLYRDETARAAAWHVPLPHDYEQWSDVRAYDGTASLVQPVMRPLHPARPAHEILARLLEEGPYDPLAGVQRTWQAHLASQGPFAQMWRESLRRGIVEGTAEPALDLSPRGEASPPQLRDHALVALCVADASVDDGRFANNAWLQELPRPLTKLTWDNAVLVAPANARTLGVRTGDVVRVQGESGALEGPVWVLPGQAEGVVTLPLGYGRTAAGSVGSNVGFDAYRLRTQAAAAAPIPVALEKSGRRHAFATTQNHARMEGRAPVRHATLAQFLRNPRFATDAPSERTPERSLYPGFEYSGYAWGMAIDLNACIGCSACTIACQAENNIAVVGKEEVARGREMHWIRVDRYYDGPAEAPRTYFQPVPCMHCENAPCEVVCPVEATVHDSEGLNVQVYNRCIGTRFCNQNCPYKVRRFNFLQYAAKNDPGLRAQRNPEVSVRRRGVMEKCSYCVQRITRARIEAEKAGRRIRDGEVVTACQAVCPTRAISFGDLNDPASAVRRVKASARDYALLAELNTRPRTTYLARVEHPDPGLEP